MVEAGNYAPSDCALRLNDTARDLGDGGNFSRTLGTKFAPLIFCVVTGSFCNCWKCSPDIP
jgi:hypothetical protein